MTERPKVLFVCVHNAGRSQMAAGFLRTLGGDDVDVFSAGTAPADSINPVVVEAMRELGVDLSSQTPRVLQSDVVQASDVVVTMGCGDECPFFPGTTYLDWDLPDPAGKDLAAVRPIRDDIHDRVVELLRTLRAGKLGAG
jgi:arsenate reductase (thioredoxin)